MKMRYRVLMVVAIISSIGWVYTVATGIPDDRGGVIAARQAFAGSAPEMHADGDVRAPGMHAEGDYRAAGMRADAQTQTFAEEVDEVATTGI